MINIVDNVNDAGDVDDNGRTGAGVDGWVGGFTVERLEKEMDGRTERFGSYDWLEVSL